ncbi:unnamed protein product [Penicillium nalgiovense]|uniref:Uncharacterized protein n=1 Tax=Penicillium nalgiovense TaxID=60175 RepID=A0A9W4IL25_PENNA|nr:unnamed protein product [Penicillium nalgiovense]CAG8030333.1 unnamed protein product [Penicillium nalgiovense]CAG8060758.1 unnamed protein product [Penicillium nalgiovense]CAG8081785.1 unnamed protein product [Penicillium nalgiovense]CAG8090870.1 unnamed protein product [Penicillium nalgiovense]
MKRSLTYTVMLTTLTTTGLRGAAFGIGQCTRFEGAPGDGNCTNSKFQIKNIEIDGLPGTNESTRLASLQCSAIAPCTNITVVDGTLHLDSGTAVSESYSLPAPINPMSDQHNPASHRYVCVVRRPDVAWIESRLKEDIHQCS